ncbi:MAG: CHASE domain-containing protein [Persicimonas sp.]
MSAIGQRATRLIATVDALNAYYVGSVRIHSDEFAAFAQSFLNQGDIAHTVQWIPRVRAQDRQGYVEDARENIRHEYQILEFLDDGTLVEAQDRDEYFPIAYLEARAPTEIAHGFDWGSVSMAREALEAARDRAQPVMTSALDLPGEAVQAPHLFVFSPVYDGPRPPAAIDDRRERLKGFVAVSAPLEELVREVLRDGEAAGARLYLVDVSGDSPKLLYPTVESGAQIDTLLERHAERQVASQYRVERDFGVAGRTWQLLGHPTASYLSQRTRTRPQQVLAGGLALTVLVVGFLVTLAKRSRTASQVVEERTRELELANEQLSAKTEDLERYQTELQEAKHTAERASNAKSELLAHLSHDLRTPLNAVIGFTSLLARTELDEEQREYLETVEESARRLLEMVDRALEVSRVDVTGAERSHSFSLAQLVEATCQPYQREAESKGLGFELKLDEELPDSVVGDPVGLREVIDRVVENAVKFTDEGRIEVEVSRVSVGDEHVCVRFAVCDTGIGVPEEMREEIFEAFTRVEQPLSRQFGGMGLGLAVAQRLVEQMRGKIWLETQIGRGSTIYFTVELGVPGDGDVEHVAGSRDDEVAPMRVLLVEDSELNRRLVMRLLGHQGHDISIAEDGEKAVEAFEPGAFDVVLMDIQLPKMSGLDATEHIRQKERRLDGARRTPIIALTAQTRQEEREKILASGVDEYLPKPLDVGQLRKVLGRLPR